MKTKITKYTQIDTVNQNTEKTKIMTLNMQIVSQRVPIENALAGLNIISIFK